MEPKTATFSGHRDCVYALCAGPGDHQFFSAGADGAVVLWDVDKPEAGKMIAQVETSVYAIHYFPEDQLLLIAANRDGFHLVDLKTGKEIWKTPTRETVWFRMVPGGTGEVVAAGSGGQLVRIDARVKTMDWISCPAGDIRALSIQSSGEVAIGNSNGEIALSFPGKSNWAIIPKAHKTTVFGLRHYPFDHRLVSCGRDGLLKLWAVAESGITEQISEVPAHLFGIHDVQLHPSKPILATCSMDKTLKIWDAENLRLLRVLDKTRHAGHGHSINQILWMGKRELLLSCSDDRTISAWDIYR